MSDEVSPEGDYPFLSFSELMKADLLLPTRPVSVSKISAPPPPEYEFEIVASDSRRAVIDVENEKVTFYVTPEVTVDKVKNDKIQQIIKANSDKKTIEVILGFACEYSVEPSMQTTCKWFTPSVGQVEFAKEETGVTLVPSVGWKWDRLPETTGCSHPQVDSEDPTKVEPCHFDGDMFSCQIYEPTEWVPVKIVQSKSNKKKIVLETSRRGAGMPETSFDDGEGRSSVSKVEDFVDYASTLVEDPEVLDPDAPKSTKVSFFKSVLS